MNAPHSSAVNESFDTEVVHLLAALLSTEPSEGLEQAFFRCNKLSLIELANKNFLNFALYYALHKKSLLHYLSDEEAAYLKDFFELNQQRNRDFLLEFNDIALALNAQGIEPVLLKGGVALLDDWYEDEGERFLRDIDFLVPEAQAQKAYQLLIDSGYELVNPLDEQLHELKTHQLAALHRKGSSLVVEIHTSPITLKAVRLLSAEQVHGDKLSVSKGALSKLGKSPDQVANFAIPSPQHCLLIALVHTQIADNNREKAVFFLRHAMDVQRLLNRYEALDLRAANHLFDKQGFTALLADYLYALDFFFNGHFFNTLSLSQSAQDQARMELDRILANLSTNEELNQSLESGQLKRAYLKQQIKNAFSREKIVMRYGVNDGIRVNIYRLVNAFRLLKKYSSVANREKLDSAMNENLSTRITLGDKE